MDPGWVRALRHAPRSGARASHDALPQAPGAAPPSWPEARRHRRFQESVAARPAQIKRRLPKGTPTELWWQDEARVGQQTKLIEEIAFHVAPGANAVVLRDQAGWHGSSARVVPPHITLTPLSPECPELNPAETLWQSMRDNRLSRRIFTSDEDIADHCCFARNPLVDQPGRLMSIGRRQQAHGC